MIAGILPRRRRQPGVAPVPPSLYHDCRRAAQLAPLPWSATRKTCGFPNHYTMIVALLRNSLRSLARRPGKPAVFLIIIPWFTRIFYSLTEKCKVFCTKGAIPRRLYLLSYGKGCGYLREAGPAIVLPTGDGRCAAREAMKQESCRP